MPAGPVSSWTATAAPSADALLSQFASSSSTRVCTAGALTAPTRSVSTGAEPSTIPSSAAVFSSRSSSVLNCSRAKMSRTAFSSIGRRSRSAGPTGSSTSSSSLLSRRLRSAFSFWSRRFWPTTPLISSACATISSTVPYCCTHLTAVFSPTLSMPIRLSLVSPTSAAISGYWCGSMP